MLLQDKLKFFYFQMFMFLGGMIACIFSLLTAFVPGLCFAWVGYEPWEHPELGLHIEYLSMQPQVYVLTPWRLLSFAGGILGIISMLKNDTKYLRLGPLGVILGLVGLFGSLPLRGGVPGDLFRLLSLPAYCLLSLGVAIMLSAIVIKFGGWYRLTLLSLPAIGIFWLIYPTTAFFDLQLYVSLTNYHAPMTIWQSILFLLALILAFFGCFLCLLKTLRPLVNQKKAA